MSDFKLTPGFVKPEPDKLPLDWAIGQLGSLCTIHQGGKLGLTKEANYRSSGTPAYSAAGQDGFVDVAEYKDTSGVVLSAIGANCGRCFFADGDWSTLANIQAIIPRSEALNAKYLFYRVNREAYWTRSGSAQPFIKPTSIKSSWLAYPANPWEQEKIATVLSSIDGVIEKTKALIAKYQQIKAGLMHDLFTRGVTADGKLRPPREQAPELYQETPIGWIPKEWDVKRLVDLIAFPSGQVDPRQSQFAEWILVAPDHIEKETGRLLGKQTAREQGAISGKYTFQPGDIVYSKIRPYLRKAILADFTGLCSADMYPLRPVSGVNPHYLLGVVLGDHFSRFAESVSMRSGFPKINRDEMSGYQCAVPPSSEQEIIAEILLIQDALLTTTQEEVAKLHQQKHGLMHDLLTGSVRVHEDIQLATVVL